MKYRDLLIELTILPGADIFSASEQLCGFARDNEIPVTAKFNDIELVATRFTNPKLLVDRYYNAINKRDRS